MTKKKITFLFISVLIFFGVVYVLLPSSLHAVTLEGRVNEQLKTGAVSAGYGEQAVDMRIIVARIISIILGLMGTIFGFLIVLSGYWYLTAQGEEEKVKKAQKTMQAAIIGLFIVVLSFSITYFVSRNILSASKSDTRAIAPYEQ
jgi:archaellum component FlaF (FlaF/FlaG flagellin family)